MKLAQAVRKKNETKRNETSKHKIAINKREWNHMWVCEETSSLSSVFFLIEQISKLHVRDALVHNFVPCFVKQQLNWISENKCSRDNGSSQLWIFTPEYCRSSLVCVTSPNDIAQSEREPASCDVMQRNATQWNAMKCNATKMQLDSVQRNQLRKVALQSTEPIYVYTRISI